ncbi:hypothetical protein [Neobacillus sp. Marseille-QA0830]
MFQLMIDHLDMTTLYALSISIYFGMILKFVWSLGVKYSYLGDTNPEKTKIIHPSFFYQKKNHLTGSYIRIRIVKYIRRKECSKDDSEDPFSSLLVT